MKILFGITSLIFILLLTDCFLLKTVDTSDQIDHFSSEHTYSHRSQWDIPFVITKHGLKIYLPESDGGYGYSDTCKLLIMDGMVSRLPVGVAINFEGKYEYYSSSVINRTIGCLFLTILEAGILIYLLYELVIKKTMTKAVLYSADTILLFMLYQIITN